MQSLQAHAPEMKAIQAKYKGDRQKQSEELQKFYKENNINPAASCLPTVAQFPVFIALYFTLRHQSHNITGTWLHVVHVADRHAISHWSGYVLLVIYAGSQVASTYFMGTTMDKTQRTIMMVLPLVFLTVVSRFPTGLVLYWMTTNLWTVGPGPDHAPADAEARALRSRGSTRPEAELAHRACGRAGRGGERQARAAAAAEAGAERAAPRQEEEGRRAPVSHGGLRGGDRGDRRRGEVEGAARPRAHGARASTRRASATRSCPRASAACSASATRRPG